MSETRDTCGTLPDWLPQALRSRGRWGMDTGNDSHGTSRLLLQVAHLLETGVWVDDIEKVANPGADASGAS